ncbi:hypothetical protein SOPP22_05365 [Shewanella sp. OPT22]|nr:hypothetical protein SOPP22_05365 [Shewanella sp. OPT22]
MSNGQSITNLLLIEKAERILSEETVLCDSHAEHLREIDDYFTVLEQIYVRSSADEPPLAAKTEREILADFEILLRLREWVTQCYESEGGEGPAFTAEMKAKTIEKVALNLVEKAKETDDSNRAMNFFIVKGAQEYSVSKNDVFYKKDRQALECLEEDAEELSKNIFEKLDKAFNLYNSIESDPNCKSSSIGIDVFPASIQPIMLSSIDKISVASNAVDEFYKNRQEIVELLLSERSQNS